jgi:hypothetical protein
MEAFSTLIEYNGQPAVQAMFLDITEHKKAEEQNGETKRNFIIVDSSQLLCFIKIEMGNSRVNKAFAEALQMPGRICRKNSF